MDADERKIMEALTAGEPLMAVEIQRRTGLETELVSGLLLALQSQALVRWDVDADRGVWMLTAAGREAISGR